MESCRTTQTRFSEVSIGCPTERFVRVVKREQVLPKRRFDDGCLGVRESGRGWERGCQRGGWAWRGPPVNRLPQVTPAGQNVWEIWGHNFQGKSQDGTNFAAESGRLLQAPLLLAAAAPGVRVDAAAPAGPSASCAPVRDAGAPPGRCAVLSRLVRVRLPHPRAPGVELVAFNTVPQHYTLPASVTVHAADGARVGAVDCSLRPNWQPSWVRLPAEGLLGSGGGCGARRSLRLTLATAQGESGVLLLSLSIDC